MTTQEMIYGPGGMNEALQLPGISNAWTMPIKARIDMLTTGVRTPLGIKVLGSDLGTIEEIGENIEMVLKDIPGTTSVFAERTTGGYFLDFDIKRDALARYGLTIDDVEMVLTSSVGGERVTTTVEGRERYPVNVRYLRDYRSDIGTLDRALVRTPAGAQVPMAQLADIKLLSGPGMIRDENGRLSGYVYVDVTGRDIGGYVRDAKKAVFDKVKVPPGYQLVWSGQYEYMERVAERLKLVVPITLFIVFLLLYFNTRSIAKTFIILLAVPFSAVGAVWFLYFLGYNMSIAVASVSRFGLPRRKGKGTDAQLERLARIDRPGRRKTPSAKSDDGGLYGVRSGAHHVVHRRGCRRDEADCSADDRRNLHILSPGIGCVSPDFRHLEMEW